MSQICFRCEFDQGLAERPCKLPAKRMKEVSRSGNIRYNHIQLCAHLQHPFHSCAGVFRTLTFITMRQKHYKSIHPVPLLFAAGYELVDDDLCTICKVPELCLPQHQRIWRSHCISIFKTYYAVFAQKRIVYSELSCSARNVSKPAVRLIGHLVADDSVTMRKCASPNILAAHSHVLSFKKKASICKQFCGCPIYFPLFIEQFNLILDNFFNFLKRLEIFRPLH